MLLFLVLGVNGDLYSTREEFVSAYRTSKLYNTPWELHPMRNSHRKLEDSHPHLRPEFDAHKLPLECYTGIWPNVTNCVEWWVNETAGVRMGVSNDIPPHYVPPYCPFGTGQGYCQSPVDGNSTDCAPFPGLVCPCVPGSMPGCPPENPSVGDVMVPHDFEWVFPLHPDPTDPSKPWHMYAECPLKTGDTYQVVGAHLNGVEFKGPAEANGFNVDLSLIPLPCGGHVTPPVGDGPTYHYHKIPDCTNIVTPGDHGPLIGWANDGFGIYGVGDYHGNSVVDECLGHFGPVDKTGVPVYHYHAQGVYNSIGADVFQPYIVGCMGPSHGKCNTTVTKRWDNGANWCGPGCGSDICVQPGTDQGLLEDYLETFGSRNWLDDLDVNDYIIDSK